MQLPVDPPPFEHLLQEVMSQDPALISRLLNEFSEVDAQGRYLHWDKFRHLPVPADLTAEQCWLGIKIARRNNYKSLSLHNKHGHKFRYCLPAVIQQELHYLDRHAAGSIQAEKAITDSETRTTYLIRGLIEEAINSSQLEGASTTQNVAKEMIRQARTPTNKSEHMIFNNYQAMHFIRESKNDLLTPSMIFELHRILTKNTLDTEDQSGRFRLANEDINVVDNASQIILHQPPHADELPKRLQALCDFANTDVLQSATPDIFLHPVIKAITLHFMLGYDHPFCDGNGRTARAIFYWAMVRQGYWLAEFISISGIIKQSPAQYGKAYLHTETDDNDLTYFLIHQLDVIHQAIAALHEFLRTKMQDINAAEQILTQNIRLKNRLNFRQLALLRHALKHPRFAYVIEEHQRSHGISYDIARKDLLFMAEELKLLTKTKDGKRYLFIAPDDIAQRIRK
ncbi:MAG: Fic family protein [Gammaproteobacteria bacterium]|nr:Fic family protein [Gammaproteobacteria bacterium]